MEEYILFACLVGTVCCITDYCGITRCNDTKPVNIIQIKDPIVCSQPPPYSSSG